MIWSAVLLSTIIFNLMGHICGKIIAPADMRIDLFVSRHVGNIYMADIDVVRCMHFNCAL